MKDLLLKSFLFVILFTIICGLIYPFGITGIAQIAFHKQANGNVVQQNGIDIAFENIGQNFIQDKYFWGRPSISQYQYTKASNQDIKSQEYIQLLEDRKEQLQQKMQTKQEVPIELITASASGLDPNLTPEGAYYQVKRIAKARNIEEETINKIIEDSIEEIPFMMNKVVNIVQLNRKLDNL